MKKLVFIAISALLMVGCQNKTETKIIVKNSDSLAYSNYADSIVYGVIVKNPNIEDTWQESCLKSFKREAFIDTIFQDLYNGELIAYSIDNNQPFSIAQIKEFENRKNFSRGIIGKFQFNESWKFDGQSKSFIKKVNSISFGYESINDDGSVKEYYLPLFKVNFN